MADVPIIPYYIRAIHEWILDSSLTPYISVYTKSDLAMQVPMEYVNDNGYITFNISPNSTVGLLISNEVITFRARFKGRPMDIVVPIETVANIYAKENGQGMHFQLDLKPRVPKAKTKADNEKVPHVEDLIYDQPKSNVIDLFSRRKDKNNEV